MKSASVQLVESFFDNPLRFLKLEEPQRHGNMVVLPLVLKGSTLDFICVSEAEKQGKIKIVETDSVELLKVINNSDQQVLIPFGVTVHGGKQDRTIWEPILLPARGKQQVFRREGFDGANDGKEVIIPAKCIEQSRWRIRANLNFEPSNIRLNPKAAYLAMSPAGQGAVWNEIQELRDQIKVEQGAAPTQSYLDITRNKQKKIDSLVNKFENVNDQCGVAVFINGEFIGIEFYANPNAWRVMSKEILGAFAVEAIRDEDKPAKEIKDHYHNLFINTFRNSGMNFTVRKGHGLGDVVEFNSQDGKWRGITLAHENTMVQFYLVKREDTDKTAKIENNQQYRQRIIPQPFRIPQRR